MNRQQKLIIKELKAGHFQLTLHARKRMNERFVSELDIIEVAKTFTTIRYQKEQETYLLSGLNTWGEDLFIVAALREKVIIVTVFFEEPL